MMIKELSGFSGYLHEGIDKEGQGRSFLLIIFVSPHIIPWIFYTQRQNVKWLSSVVQN